jgi:flotillin
MDLTILIMLGVIVILVALTVFGLLKRFKKCPSDKLLVVWGKLGKNKSAKVYPGGGVFVWPVIQDWGTMEMRPLKIFSHVKGPDKGMVTTHVDIALTTGISTDPEVQLNAVNRFLSAKPNEIEEQIKTILDGAIRDIVASMPIEDLNSNRDKFKEEVFSSLADKLTKVGYGIIDINIQQIQDEDDYLNNLGKKKVTKAAADAQADIADMERAGKVRIAEIKRDEATDIAQADKAKQVNVATAEKEKAVEVANIDKDKEISIATADKDRQTGIADQESEKRAQVARAKANAEIAEAEADADAISKVAVAEANADAAKAEAEAEKEIRMAKADQKQEAETIQAIQEKEAKKAEYTSQKDQRKATAERDAGVAQQEAKIAVAEATAKAGQAEAEQLKTVESAKVDATTTVAKLQQERNLEVNEAKAKAEKAKLTAEKIVPAEMDKQTVLINADASKQQTIIEAEAQAEAIRKKAEAEAAAIRLKREAEAAGVEAMGKAEGAREEAIAVGRAKGVQQEALAEAMKYERMINAAGGDVGALTQLMLSERVEAGYNAITHQFEALRDANITVVGNPSTTGDLIGNLVSKCAPGLQLLQDGLKKQVMDTFGFGKKPEIPEKTVESSKETKE